MFKSSYSRNFVLLILLCVHGLTAQIKFQDVLPGTPAEPILSNIHLNGITVLKLWDENNDGFTDFYGIDCEGLNLFYSNGDGSFTRFITGIDTGGYEIFIFFDPDGDNDLDVFAARIKVLGALDPAETRYFKNTGNGLYKRDTLGIMQNPLAWVFPLDFDQDGDQDLLGVERHRSTTPGIPFIYEFISFENNGNGSFNRLGKAGLDSNIFFTANQPGFRFVDFNNDQKLDIIHNRYNLYEGKGDGTFQKKTNLTFFIQWIADLDGNGSQEVVGLSRDSVVRISRYDPQKDTFALVKSNFVNVSGNIERIVDWDLDGDLDLIVRNNKKANYAALINDGQNSFSIKPNKLLSNSKGKPFRTAHFRGSSKKDLLSNSELYLNHLDSNKTKVVRNSILRRGFIWNSFFFGNTLSSKYSNHSFFGDINGDSYPDFTTQKIISDKLHVGARLNLKNGRISLESTSFLKVAGAKNAFLFDFNGDGVRDALIRHENNGSTYTFYANDGQGNFNLISNDSLPLPYRIVPYNSKPVDIDSDGDLDLVTTDNVNTSVERNGILLNDGQGKFTLDTRRSFRTLQDGGFEFADLNQNGYPDLVISGDTLGFQSSYTQVYFNDGNQLNPSKQQFTGLSHGRVNIADLDNNGTLDLILTGRLNNSADGNLVYLNDSSGNFTPVPPDTFGFTVNQKAVIQDLDGDGINEIVQPQANTTAVYKLDSNVRYRKINTTGTQISRTIADEGLAVDMDKDGKKDILLAGEDKIFCVPIVRHFRNLSQPNISLKEHHRQKSLPDFTLYPNPVSDYVTIKNNLKSSTPVMVQLHSITGELKYESEINTEPQVANTLPLGNIKTGVYIITIKQKGNVAATRLKVIKL